MVKIFIGNVPREANQSELRGLFEQYGTVSECDIIKNYGFVHMDDREAAEEAIRNLHQYELHGVKINVETSKGKPKASTKLHVSNISSSVTSKELKAKFEEFGPVLECDIVKDYAFVHMERSDNALDAIRNLDNYDLKGKRMHVQLSTSRLRITPGMGERSRCYRCGKDGHWSKECPLDQMALELAQGTGYPPDPYADSYMPPRSPPYTAAYAERVYYDDRERIIDYYQRYRVRPSAYEDYVERRLPSLPSTSPAVSIAYRERVQYPYERHLLPPPVANPYYSRDRSPLRRSSIDGYRAERRLSPISRSALYGIPRHTRESYMERTRYF
ncbi:RNA-binding protein 4B [Bombina bombina]|uniref:RNA-binding protein 4B n=1 Tax=Bombina bombina TaxID=8345 RepID=UPI00235AF3B3|nr:RNA-binding protein 4B [Bombina bombina]